MHDRRTIDRIGYRPTPAETFVQKRDPIPELGCFFKAHLLGCFEHSVLELHADLLHIAIQESTHGVNDLCV